MNTVLFDDFFFFLLCCSVWHDILLKKNISLAVKKNLNVKAFSLVVVSDIDFQISNMVNVIDFNVKDIFTYNWSSLYNVYA
jgi:hypothetical protein